MQPTQKLQESLAFIREHSKAQPAIGVVLGSGLGHCADSLQNPEVIPFRDIPHFPIPRVAGHAGNLVLGDAGGIATVVLQGRIHFYERCSISEATYGVRVLGLLGIRILVVTNAAGGINQDLKPGDLMLISDHLNLMGTNPLIGREFEEGEQTFPDMSEAYDPSLRTETLRIGAEEGIPLRQGVYAGMPGPSYETPAEIRMIRTLGADAIGMSTVPEVIVANQIGMRVLGISCISNLAAGISPLRLQHREVLETTERAATVLGELLQAAIPRLVEA